MLAAATAVAAEPARADATTAARTLAERIWNLQALVAWGLAAQVSLAVIAFGTSFLAGRVRSG